MSAGKKIETDGLGKQGGALMSVDRPRTRYLMPEFFWSRTIVRLDPIYRLLYQALWTASDREGVFDWDPYTLKIRFFAFDGDARGADEHEAWMIRGLRILARVGLVKRFGPNAEYGFLPNFVDNQSFNWQEKKGDLPSFDPSTEISEADWPEGAGDDMDQSGTRWTRVDDDDATRRDRVLDAYESRLNRAVDDALARLDQAMGALLAFSKAQAGIGLETSFDSSFNAETCTIEQGVTASMETRCERVEDASETRLDQSSTKIKRNEKEKEKVIEIDNLRSTITQPSNFENSNVLEVVPGDGKGKGKANPPLLNTQKGGSQHLRPASGHAPPPNEAQMFEKILWVLWNLAQRTGQGVTDSDVRRYLAEHNPLRRLIEELGPAPTLALRLFSDQQMGTVKSWGYLWENRFSIGAKIAGSNQPDPNGWDAAMEILERRGLRSDDSESVWGEEAL